MVRMVVRLCVFGWLACGQAVSLAVCRLDGEDGCEDGCEAVCLDGWLVVRLSVLGCLVGRMVVRLSAW